MGIFKQEPQPMSVAGLNLTCEICKHTLFFTRDAQLNTPGMTLFGLDWANTTATCAVCAHCGYVHWFLPT